MSAHVTRAHTVLVAGVLLCAASLVGALREEWTVVAAATTGLLLLVLLLLWRVRDVALLSMRRVQGVPTLRREVGALRTAVASLDERISALHREVESAERQRRSDHHLLTHVNLPEVVSDVEALPQLYARITPRAPMPPSGGWALRPTDLLTLSEHLRVERPNLVVELGSGTSTIWFSYLLEAAGSGRLVSLEHDPVWVEQSRAMLLKHGFAPGGSVEVRHAPLTPTELPNHRTPWYDPAAILDLEEIDLLVVDGPPASTGRDARYPAAELLLERVSIGGLVIVDDAGREDERRMIDRWRTEHPSLERVRLPGPAGSHVALRRAG